MLVGILGVAGTILILLVIGYVIWSIAEWDGRMP